MGFYIGVYEIRTIWLNTFVILFWLGIIACAVQLSLRKQLTKV
jgi:hypothetical protein